MTVLVAGGGIAGLTLALSLHQLGVPVSVFESVETPRALGVGINLLPHAVREFCELGLEEKLAAIAIPTKELAYFSRHGKPIWQEPRGVADSDPLLRTARPPRDHDLAGRRRRPGRHTGS